MSVVLRFHWTAFWKMVVIQSSSSSTISGSFVLRTGYWILVRGVDPMAARSFLLECRSTGSNPYTDWDGACRQTADAQESPQQAAKPIKRQNENLPLDQQIARTTALMRTLISGDAPATLASDGMGRPSQLCLCRNISGRVATTGKSQVWTWRFRNCCLTCSGLPSGDVFAELLAGWKENRDCWLAIHPFLTDMQVGEQEIPRSVIQSVSAHVSKEGLRLITDAGRQLERIST